MPSALRDEEILAPDEIDMERVVADPAYRRRVITRLRRERIQARNAALADDLFEAAGEED